MAICQVITISGQNRLIDDLILAAASATWRKGSTILNKTIRGARDGGTPTTEDAVLARIKALIADRRLEQDRPISDVGSSKLRRAKIVISGHASGRSSTVSTFGDATNRGRRGPDKSRQRKSLGKSAKEITAPVTPLSKVEQEKRKRRWAIYDWVYELETKLPLSDAIDAVYARRRQADEIDVYDLALCLKSLLMSAERYEEAGCIIDEMINRCPDDVRFPLAKVSLQFYFLRKPAKALQTVNEALERAHRTKFFRREALGDKARILLALGRGEDLTRTLEEIMALTMYHDIPDIGRERDFVDRAPPGMIPAAVLARYDVFCPKKR